MPLKDCMCERHLSDYVVYYMAHPEAYVNHDWIRATGTLIDSVESRHRIMSHHVVEDAKTIQAYHVGEVQRYIEYKLGDEDKKPLHKLIVNGKVFQECRHKQLFNDLAKAESKPASECEFDPDHVYHDHNVK
jgi:hypothetical protein